MPWSAVAASVAGGVVNKLLAPKQKKGAAQAADPFASQRPQYQAKLAELMNGNFSPSDPSYAWRFGQGMEALNRTKAAQGLTQSGNQSTALIDYGQGLASTEYGNQYSRLSQLAGANVGSPAAAGQIMYGQEQQQQAGATALGGAVANGVGKWINDYNTPIADTGGGMVDTSGFQTQPSSSGFFNQAAPAGDSFAMLPDSGMSSSWWAAA